MQEIIMADFDNSVIRRIERGVIPNTDITDSAEANPAMIVKNHAFVKRIKQGDTHKIVFEIEGGHDFTYYSDPDLLLPVLPPSLSDGEDEKNEDKK